MGKCIRKPVYPRPGREKGEEAPPEELHVSHSQDPLEIVCIRIRRMNRSTDGINDEKSEEYQPRKRQETHEKRIAH
ncbi:hypothetical protein FACS1894137_02430 [Spirochaetia bacterium]|nr:hypothetical protein FACS1894137_02430 [Spirochaetia bacterium]